MSTCISSHGEYDSHETDPGTFVCEWCHEFDEAGALAEIARLRRGPVTGMEHAIEQVANALHGDQCAEDPDPGERCNCGAGDFYRQAEIVLDTLREAGLLAPAPLREEVEEAYQRGHEDGYWNGKTTDMSPAQAAAFMAPYRSRCPGCADRAEGDGSADCGCAYCHTGPFPIMHVCADCGSKRCPRAIHHANPCNGRAEQ